jgi:hypothetical protein
MRTHVTDLHGDLTVRICRTCGDMVLPGAVSVRISEVRRRLHDRGRGRVRCIAPGGVTLGRGGVKHQPDRRVVCPARLLHPSMPLIHQTGNLTRVDFIETLLPFGPFRGVGLRELPFEHGQKHRIVPPRAGTQGVCRNGGRGGDGRGQLGPGRFVMLRPGVKQRAFAGPAW